MYKPQPIPPTVLRLTGAAQAVLDLAHTGDLFNLDPAALGRCTERFDALWRANEEAIACFPDGYVSPFLRHRDEILATDQNGLLLQALVMHLWNSSISLNLGNTIWLIDCEKLPILVELIDSYTRNGEKDKVFMELAAEIGHQQMGAAA